MSEYEIPERPPTLMFWCGCCREGVPVGRHLRAQRCNIVIQFIFIPPIFILFFKYPLHIFWTGMMENASFGNICFFMLFVLFELIFIYKPVVTLIRCLKEFVPMYCFQRRKQIFKKKKSIKIPLPTILESIDQCIPDLKDMRDVEHIAKRYLTWIPTYISTAFDGLEMKLILTGSAAERFNSPISPRWLRKVGIKADNENHALVTDYDFMVCPNRCFASHCIGEMFFIDRGGCSPEFARLTCNQMNGYFSAKRVRNAIYDSILNMDVAELPGFHGYTGGYECYYRAASRNQEIVIRKQGPAVKTMVKDTKEKRFFLVDLTFSIKCTEWPGTSDWPHRAARKWPKEADVRHIVNRVGCHLVPKSPKNDKEGVYWRYSFSAAEVELSKLMPLTARKCFIALKIIGKDYIQPTCKQITSYCLKTIFLNTLEQTALEFWHNDRISECFHLLLKNLSQVVDTRICPHHWLCNVNLFEENLSVQNVKKLLKLLEKIKENPCDYIESFTLPSEVGIDAIENSTSSESKFKHVRNYGTYVYTK